MSRSVSFTVMPEDVGMRLDVLLTHRDLYGSRSAAARAIEAGCVLVCGRSTQKGYVVRNGDTIVCELEDSTGTAALQPQPIDLDIRYEDDDVIVLSKQLGLVCHPSSDHKDMTLVNALLYHCGRDHLCNVQGDDDRFGIVHRLDRDTTGLMLAAKNDEAGFALIDEISLHTIDRRYLCLVHGNIPHDTGMIDAPIARSADERTHMAIRDVASARDAVTTFRVLERFEATSHDDGYTLIECKLFTGRTHQIRVHMQYTNHPVVGDPVYCSGAPRDPAAQLGLKRQFLHSYFLEFTQPRSGETLFFADNLAHDLACALEKLSPRSCGKTEAGLECEVLLESAPIPCAEPIETTEPAFEVY